MTNTCFSIKVKHYSRIIEVNPKKIISKNLKNRGGNITQGATMKLNKNLVKAPENIIDYIIIH